MEKMDISEKKEGFVWVFLVEEWTPFFCGEAGQIRISMFGWLKASQFKISSTSYITKRIPGVFLGALM